MRELNLLARTRARVQLSRSLSSLCSASLSCHVEIEDFEHSRKPLVFDNITMPRLYIENFQNPENLRFSRHLTKMPKTYNKKPIQQQKIAEKRIKFLFQHAKEMFREDSRISDKYINMARRIAMKYKIRIPSSLKKRFCKNCHKYLVPGVNCRVRIHKHRLIYYCFGCKHYMRHPVK